MRNRCLDDGGRAGDHSVGGVELPYRTRPNGRVGNENVTSAPSGSFAAVHGPLNIIANRDAQWEILARPLSREDVLKRHEYATRDAHKANREALRRNLEEVLSTRPAQAALREHSARRSSSTARSPPSPRPDPCSAPVPTRSWPRRDLPNPKSERSDGRARFERYDPRCRRLVAHLDHRHGTGAHHLARVSCRRADRRDEFRRDHSADAPQRPT
ncbi:MAG: CoA transferase [Pseudomonadota bacterium]